MAPIVIVILLLPQPSVVPLIEDNLSCQALHTAYSTDVGLRHIHWPVVHPFELYSGLVRPRMFLITQFFHWTLNVVGFMHTIQQFLTSLHSNYPLSSDKSNFDRALPVQSPKVVLLMVTKQHIVANLM